MYGLPGSPIQFGAKRAKKKPGRKSDWSKFVEKQRDLFPVDLYTSKLTVSHQAERMTGGPRPTVKGAAGDQTAARAVAFLSGGKVSEECTGFDLGFSDLRRCSTADQSGLPDFEDFPDGD